MGVVVVVVAAAAVAAEWWLRERGVQAAADRLAEALDASVELHVIGRPLLQHVLRRHLPGVRVVTTSLPIVDGRATLDRLQVDLQDLRLVGRGDQRHVVATSGRFTTRLASTELRDLVELPPYLMTFDVHPRGLRLQTLAGVFVDASLRLDGDSLLVRPAGSVLRLLPQPQFRLPLPQLPHGASIEGFDLHVGSVDAWGPLDPDELAFPVAGFRELARRARRRRQAA